MTFQIIRPRPPITVVRTDGRVRVNTGGPGLRGLPGAPGAAGAPGSDGAYAAADAMAVPILTDYAPVQIGGVSKRAYLSDVTPFNFINALPDGGRFGGTEPNVVQLSGWTAPAYLGGYNGSSFAQGAKRVNNSSTYGGTGAALDADVQALVEDMQPGAGSTFWRYGPEFYLADFNCPATTTLNLLTVGGINHYLCLASGQFPLPRVHAVHCWFKVTSGAVAVPGPYNTTERRVFVDGAEISAAASYGPGGWHRVGFYYIQPLSTWRGYAGTIIQLYATVGATFRMALPVLMLGHAYKGDRIGAVPSIGAIR